MISIVLFLVMMISKDTWKDVELLKNDREHGAAQLFARGAAIILDALRSDDLISPHELLPLVKAVLDAQPSMAPLINLCNKVMVLVESGRNLEAVEYLEGVVSCPGTGGAGLMRDRLTLLLQGRERVVVFSYSSTVTAALASTGVRPQVLTHRGHPIDDGLKSADFLHSKGFQVTLTSDLCLPGMLKEGDVVLTGCDAITVSGMVNRSGTYPLLLAARDRDVPVVVLTDESKLLPAPLESFLEVREAPAEEMLPGGAEYRVRHFYFEMVPLSLVSVVITPNRDIAVSELVPVLKNTGLVSRLLSILAFDT